MISVIIPTYNEESVIGTLLSSLSRQDCAKDLEIVVSDNQSKDKTREIARSFEKSFHSLLLVDGGMPGPGRNAGAKASSGELLFFIDADLYTPDVKFISKVSNYVRKNNLAIAPVYLTPLSSRLIDKLLVGFYNFILYLSKYFIRPLGAMCIICTKEAFLGTGGYPEDVVMAEDHDFVLYTSRKFRYGVAPFYIQFSVRRFDKEGRLGLIWKYLQAIYHNLVHGPIKKEIFEYEFGGYGRKNSQTSSLPKVTLYCELYNLFNGWFYKNIGTGFITSYNNQKKILQKQGIFFTEDLSLKTDIFQANSHGPYTFYLAWKHKKRGQKIIFYAHATCEDLEKQFRFFHFIVPVLRWYLSKLYNFADVVACPSLYTANLLNTKYNVSKNKTVWISNGVDLEKFRFNEKDREKWRSERKIDREEIAVVNVAMALERKGTKTFVNLGKIFPKVRFIWFGKIFNIIFSPKVSQTRGNVVFTGYVPDILEAYHCADIFLFPSYEEQQGISILEAGAVGLSLLVRNIPVYNGWLRDGENCLKAETEDEFKEKLSVLIDNAPLRQKLAASLRKIIEREHSFESVGMRLENLYHKLLES